MKNFRSLMVALALVAGSLVAQGSVAATLTTGSVIQLADSYGNTGGGEFIATVTGAPADTFITFCLEKNEYFTPGQNLYVKAVNTAAVNGGVGGPNPDPISAQTAYLYTMFRTGALSGYDFVGTGATRIASANSFQKAIWYLEEEITYGETDAQAQAWITAANTAVSTNAWTGIGNVRVLNLYQDANFTTRAQDQLYLLPVPEPEIYAMMGLGLGLLGWVGRRRKLQAA